MVDRLSGQVDYNACKFERHSIYREIGEKKSRLDGTQVPWHRSKPIQQENSEPDGLKQGKLRCLPHNSGSNVEAVLLSSLSV